MIPNDSQLDFQTIGTENNALLCVTPFRACCKANKRGEIFRVRAGGVVSPLPLRRDSRMIYRNRGTSVVRLNRRDFDDDASSFLGPYRCCLPNGCGEEQCININLV